MPLESFSALCIPLSSLNMRDFALCLVWSSLVIVSWNLLLSEGKEKGNGSGNKGREMGGWEEWVLVGMYYMWKGPNQLKKIKTLNYSWTEANQKQNIIYKTSIMAEQVGVDEKCEIWQLCPIVINFKRWLLQRNVNLENIFKFLSFLNICSNQLWAMLFECYKTVWRILILVFYYNDHSLLFISCTLTIRNKTAVITSFHSIVHSVRHL